MPATVNNDKSLCRDCITLGDNLQREVVTLAHGKTFVEDKETEGCRAFVGGAVVHNTLGGFCDGLRSGYQEYGYDSERWQRVLEITTVGMQVDGVKHRHRLKLYCFLLNGRLQ